MISSGEDSGGVPHSHKSSASETQSSADGCNSFQLTDSSGEVPLGCEGTSYISESVSTGCDGERAAELPERLFATDRFPSDGRVNSYSRMQYLVDIVDIIYGTKEFDVLMRSQFGALFRLPTSRCSLSGKLVHNVLCRQIMSKNKHDIWFTFGGIPLRFSILEFEKVTGLRCGPYPTKAGIIDGESGNGKRKSHWKTLFGTENVVTVVEIVARLRSDLKMAGWRRLQLVLIVLVEGVLICGTQPVIPSSRVVDMVQDVKAFLEYPWGRESFLMTLRMIKVGARVKTANALVMKLQKSSVAQHGFPLAIQLWLFEVIPSLLNYLPRSDSGDTFLDRQIADLPRLTTYHTENILRLELHPTITVISRLAISKRRFAGDVLQDPRIAYLEQLLDSGARFTKSSWSGGDSSLAPLCLCSTSKGGRCSCGNNSGGADIPSPAHNTDADQPVTPCPGCADLKQSLARLEEAQARMEGILARTLNTEVEKMRVMLLAEVRARTEEGREQLLQLLPDWGNGGKACYSRKRRDHCRSVSPPRMSTYGMQPPKRRTTSPPQISHGETSIKPSEPDTRGGDCGFTSAEFSQAKEPCSKGDQSNGDIATQENEGPRGHDSPLSAAQALSTYEAKEPCSKGDQSNEDIAAQENEGRRGHDSPLSAAQALSTDEPEVGFVQSARGTCTAIVETTAPNVQTQQYVTRKTRLNDVHSKEKHGREYFPVPNGKRMKQSNTCGSGGLGYEVFPVIPPALVSSLKTRIRRYKKRLYDLDGHVVPKEFFSQVLRPTEWLTNSHLDMIIRSVWKRCGSALLAKGITITDCYFTQFLVSNYNAFRRTQPTTFEWPSMLRSYVCGHIPDRDEVSPWCRSIHTVYAPMNWGCMHWVGLIINFRTWDIQILDPLLTATPKWKVRKFMEPVSSMLPHLLSAFCTRDSESRIRASPFTYERVPGVSSNERTGDCGPMVVKLIELHAHDLPLSGITEAMVDQLRISYAVSVYSDFVEKML